LSANQIASGDIKTLVAQIETTKMQQRRFNIAPMMESVRWRRNAFSF
jgi:hypothetical protein